MNKEDLEAHIFLIFMWLILLSILVLGIIWTLGGILK